jgi:hypothetical protein
MRTRTILYVGSAHSRSNPDTVMVPSRIAEKKNRAPLTGYRDAKTIVAITKINS